MADFWDAVADLIVETLNDIESDVGRKLIRSSRGYTTMIGLDHSPAIPYGPIASIIFYDGRVYVNGRALVVDPSEADFQLLIRRHVEGLIDSL